MALIGGSIPLGATFAPTGGSATTLASLGGSGTNLKLLVSDSAAFNLRSIITASVVESVVNASYPGGFTPTKRRLARTKPITLADGSIFTNQMILEMIVHPETSDAQITELRSTAVNCLNDADFDGFWLDSALS